MVPSVIKWQKTYFIAFIGLIYGCKILSIKKKNTFEYEDSVGINIGIQEQV